ncbi:MAG: hypothetical protein ACKOWK_01705 [Micrococcales bacterium]
MSEDRNQDRPRRDDRAGEGRPAWKKDGDRPARGGDRPARDGDRQGRGGDRPSRDGDRPARGGGRFERDGERPGRFGDRPSRGPARSERPGRAGDGRGGAERPEWQTRVERERDPERAKSPMIPEEITEKDLDLLVRVQMKTLSPENAERVSRHLAMVNLLINDDPELAHRHALAAADRAGRIGVVRETLALTAYTIGDFALALREMQAYRRISGKDDQLPIMVDCERGLGRPDKALELGRSVDPKTLDAGVRVNLAIAMSGARLDRGENQLALAELEIKELNPESVFDYSPHLFRAYGDTLEILERSDEAKRWFDLADRADVALAAKAAPAVEMQNIIEELVIPEPYEARQREDREWKPREGSDRGQRREWKPREERDRGDSPRRDGDRPSRPFGERREWKPREDRDSSDRPRRDGERPARPPRPTTGDDQPKLRFGNERKPRTEGDRGPRRDSNRGDSAPRSDRAPRNDRPEWKKRDE